jgi:hypothetical protein
MRAKYPAHRAVIVEAEHSAPIRERLVSASVREPAILTEGFAFLNQYENSWTVSLLRLRRFLQNPFQLIIHLTPYYQSCEMGPHRGPHQFSQHLSLKAEKESLR